MEACCVHNGWLFHMGFVKSQVLHLFLTYFLFRLEEDEEMKKIKIKTWDLTQA
jgi:hypothetical protein